MLRSAAILALVPLLLAGFAAQTAQDEQEAHEEAFAELLAGARLTGWFTDDTKPGEPPAQDSYEIASAEALEDGIWRFDALIGESGVKLPLFLPVKWAGDTPVITLDDLEIPGMGKFTARVLFHGSSYAGVWRGEKHGGEMAGRIERRAAGK